jgi:hypothetical protein
MGNIGPKFTRAELEQSGRHTMNGDGLKTELQTGLPAVAADAKTMDPEAHSTNRELAKQIQELVAKHKPADDGVPRFVLAWRMYPNADSKYWDAETGHVCGCGCGCPVETGS